MKEIINKKPFLMNLATLISLVIFSITMTWSVAATVVSLKETDKKQNKEIEKMSRKVKAVEMQQIQQNLDMVEIKTDLKYIIQLQEELRRGK